jgi:hypothetical protein
MWIRPFAMLKMKLVTLRTHPDASTGIQSLDFALQDVSRMVYVFV